jgi:hypothetical protein
MAFYVRRRSASGGLLREAQQHERRALTAVKAGGQTRAPAAAQERAVSGSAAWRAQIADVDVATLRHLREQVAGGFDEERFAGRIGFGNLKRCAARRRAAVRGWP